MLPILAMMVAGFMAKRHSAATQAPSSPTGGMLGRVLGGLFGGQPSGGTATPGGSAPGGLASMLDLDGDGNPLDDILRMARNKIG